MTSGPGLVAVVEARRPRGSDLTRLLRRYDHPVEVAHRLEELATIVRREDVDLVVANRAGPDAVHELSTICRPLLIGLVAVCDPDVVDVATALGLGADDYLASPPDPDELEARVRALLRRTRRSGVETDTISTDDFTIDLTSRQALDRNGEPLHLTGVEWRLVDMLVRRPGRLVATHDLLVHVWGPAAIDKPHYLRVHMAHVRRKLEPNPAEPRYFLTESGLGLRFQPTPTCSTHVARADAAVLDGEELTGRCAVRAER